MMSTVSTVSTMSTRISRHCYQASTNQLLNHYDVYNIYSLYSLYKDFQGLLMRAEKRRSEADDATMARKRHHIMVGLGVQFFVHRALRAQLQIHLQMQPSTGTGALRHNAQCIATPYQDGKVQSGCTVYFYFTNFSGFRDLYCHST